MQTKPYKRILSIFLTVCLLCTTLTGNLAFSVFAETLPQDEYNNKVNDMVYYVNQERASLGLAPLQIVPVLCDAATERATETTSLFSHTRPDGTDCFTIFDDFGIDWNACAENIAYGYSTAAATFDQWKNSSGHYANMTSASYTYIGVGIATSGSTYYWTQLFTAGGTYADAYEPTAPADATTTTTTETTTMTTTTTTETTTTTTTMTTIMTTESTTSVSYSADDSAILELDVPSAAPGETVAIDLCVYNLYKFGWASGTVIIAYDNGLIPLIDSSGSFVWTPGPACEDAAVSTVQNTDICRFTISYDTSHDLTSEGVIATLYFTVPETATVGASYPFTLLANSFFDANGTQLPFTCGYGSELNVIEATTTATTETTTTTTTTTTTASDEALIYLDVPTAAPGETVEVNICLDDLPTGWAAVGFTVQYDERLIPLTDEDGDLIYSKGNANNSATVVTALDTEQHKFAVASASIKNLTINGVITTVYFTVPGDATAGDSYALTLSVTKFGDNAANDIPYRTRDGVITVAETTTTTTETTSTTTTTSLDSDEALIYLDVPNAAPGETVEVNICLDALPTGWAAVCFTVQYDERLIPLTDEDSELIYSKGNANNSALMAATLDTEQCQFTVASASTKSLTISGVITTVYFTVPADATAGDSYALTLSVTRFDDDAANGIPYRTQDGVITVAETTTTTTETTSTTTTTSLDSDEALIYLDVPNAAPGETVEVNICLDALPTGWATVGFTVQYDERLIPLTDEDGELIYSKGNANNSAIVVAALDTEQHKFAVASASTKNLTINGVITTVYFTVPADATAADSYALALSVMKFGDNAANGIPYRTQDSVITIAETTTVTTTESTTTTTTTTTTTVMTETTTSNSAAEIYLTANTNQTDGTITLQLCVDDLPAGWGAAGFVISYDKRLTPALLSDTIACTAGTAGRGMALATAWDEATARFALTCAAVENRMTNGAIASFEFTIPADAVTSDTYVFTLEVMKFNTITLTPVAYTSNPTLALQLDFTETGTTVSTTETTTTTTVTSITSTTTTTTNSTTTTTTTQVATTTSTTVSTTTEVTTTTGADLASLYLTAASGLPGETVAVDVCVTDVTQGWASAGFILAYDASLTPVADASGELLLEAGEAAGQALIGSQIDIQQSALAIALANQTVNSTNGVICRLYFVIPEDATAGDSYALTLIITKFSDDNATPLPYTYNSDAVIDVTEPIGTTTTESETTTTTTSTDTDTETTVATVITTTTTVTAESDSALLYLNPTSGKPGETVRVDVCINNQASGWSSCTMNLSYDPDIIPYDSSGLLQLTAGAIAANASIQTQTSADSNSFICKISRADEITESGVIFSFDLTLPADAVIGSEYTISLEVESLLDNTAEEIPFTAVSSATITVIDDGTFRPADGITYIEVPGGLSVLYYVSDAEILEIPAYSDGIPVIGIEPNAFAYSENVTTVIVPYTTVSISETAFADSQISTIYGYADSAIASITDAFGLSFCILGDMNVNAILNVNDAVSVLKAYSDIMAEKLTLSDEASFLYDVNRDGRFNSNDAVAILKYDSQVSALLTPDWSAILG